jgi:hypothetical protein
MLVGLRFLLFGHTQFTVDGGPRTIEFALQALAVFARERVGLFLLVGVLAAFTCRNVMLGLLIAVSACYEIAYDYRLLELLYEDGRWAAILDRVGMAAVNNAFAPDLPQTYPKC